MKSKKKKAKGKSLITSIAVILIIVLAVSKSYSFLDKSPATISGTEYDSEVLTVYYLDVGQGDSEFIQLPNGECMLIDASTSEYGSTIVNAVENLGVTEIDYLVATHPHADHIGGMKAVVEAFDIGSVYMPKASASTKTYENLLQAISDKNLSINTAKADTVIYSSGDLTVELLAPVSTSYSDLNNYSAVVRIEYGSTVFLFTGDAEALSESEILEHYSPRKLRADVLKVGHHGSSSSSSEEFIAAVAPKYAVIEVGKENSYGHPHDEAISTLTAAGAEIYRTDLNGTIVITSDGAELSIVCEKD